MEWASTSIYSYCVVGIFALLPPWQGQYMPSHWHFSCSPAQLSTVESTLSLLSQGVPWQLLYTVSARWLYLTPHLSQSCLMWHSVLMRTGLRVPAGYYSASVLPSGRGVTVDNASLLLEDWWLHSEIHLGVSRYLEIHVGRLMCLWLRQDWLNLLMCSESEIADIQCRCGLLRCLLRVVGVRQHLF